MNNNPAGPQLKRQQTTTLTPGVVFRAKRTSVRRCWWNRKSVGQFNNRRGKIFFCAVSRGGRFTSSKSKKKLHRPHVSIWRSPGRVQLDFSHDWIEFLSSSFIHFRPDTPFGEISGIRLISIANPKVTRSTSLQWHKAAQENYDMTRCCCCFNQKGKWQNSRPRLRWPLSLPKNKRIAHLKREATLSILLFWLPAVTSHDDIRQ